jgi:predicted phage tail protein
MLESHKEKESEEVQTTLLQLKETMDVHKDVSLPEILKEKHLINARIEDFDIDCVLDEETQMNIMTEETWEILRNPTVVPSLGRIGLFKVKMITLCGRVTIVPIIVHGTSIEEEFEVIRFVGDNAPFPLLLGKTLIEKDQIKRKAEEEATEKKKQELRDFIARKIDRLIEEREDKLKQQRKVTMQDGQGARELVVKVERMQEGLKNISIQEKSMSTQEVLRKGILTSESLRASQQCKATALGEDKNKNIKRIP